jgi:hypothetical protein
MLRLSEESQKEYKRLTVLQRLLSQCFRALRRCGYAGFILLTACTMVPSAKAQTLWATGVYLWANQTLTITTIPAQQAGVTVSVLGSGDRVGPPINIVNVARDMTKSGTDAFVLVNSYTNLTPCSPVCGSFVLTSPGVITYTVAPGPVAPTDVTVLLN